MVLSRGSAMRVLEVEGIRGSSTGAALSRERFYGGPKDDTRASVVVWTSQTTA